MEKSQEVNLLKIISLIYRKMQIYLDGKMSELEISCGALPFIMITCENGGINQNRFCEILDISKGTVAKNLAKLEEQGFVTRRESPDDARCTIVYPTEKAMEIYPSLVEAGESWIELMTKDMTEIERMVFAETLRKASKNISDYF